MLSVSSVCALSGTRLCVCANNMHAFICCQPGSKRNAYNVAVVALIAWLPEGSPSRCCLAGGSSVSHGVSWLMGVCPHLTPGASSSPGVWPSPGERPETCGRKKRTHTHTQNKRRWATKCEKWWKERIKKQSSEAESLKKKRMSSVSLESESESELALFAKFWLRLVRGCQVKVIRYHILQIVHIYGKYNKIYTTNTKQKLQKKYACKRVACPCKRPQTALSWGWPSQYKRALPHTHTLPIKNTTESKNLFVKTQHNKKKNLHNPLLGHDSLPQTHWIRVFWQYSLEEQLTSHYGLYSNPPPTPHSNLPQRLRTSSFCDELNIVYSQVR